MYIKRLFKYILPITMTLTVMFILITSSYSEIQNNLQQVDPKLSKISNLIFIGKIVQIELCYAPHYSYKVSISPVKFIQGIVLPEENYFHIFINNPLDFFHSEYYTQKEELMNQDFIFYYQRDENGLRLIGVSR